MFVQVIQGQVVDREAMKRLAARWSEEIKPSAEGFLGGTAGVTDEGWLVNIARFESEAAARKNSDRPEQGAWWAEMSKCFADEPSFLESDEVELLLDGGDDRATFVQAMVGRAHDKAAMQAREASMAARLRELRPDLLGGIRVWKGNDFVELAYFTSEADARSGESASMPTDVADDFAAFQEAAGPIGYEDLRDVMIL